ncbi:MAG TPA: FAD-dependent oxidoreductase [Solirubrobacteraceae bacterium]|nr:FAD-dependent oxidoreductase [Solirubrobacteraceae bacterium]
MPAAYYGATTVSDPKVVVAGAGFAGLAAAVHLRDLGVAVEIIEARDRLGGRTWTRPFGDGGPRVEYGGTWFMPEHRRVARELERAGSPVRDHVPSAWRWRTGDKIRYGLPVDRDEWPNLEAALRRLVSDAGALVGGATDAGSLSFAGYLERLDTTSSVRDFLLGWWAVTGGSEPSHGAAIDGLAAIADHGGLLGVPDTLRRSPALGWAAIAESMADHAQAPVRYETELLAVDFAESVTLECSDGLRVTADAVVLALPLNTLDRIRFAPALPERLRASFGKNRGRALKMWLRTRGVPPASLAAGRGRGLDLLLADRAVDGDQLLVAFGPATTRFDPTDGRDVQAALQAFYPEAELIAFDSHDWNADPFSRGTWATSPVDDIDALSHRRFAPVGRVAFASSDFAPEAGGWIEGALAAGEAAAAAISETLTVRAGRAP